MPATTDPESYLPGIVDFTSEADGSVIVATFASSEDYFAIPISALPELTLADCDGATGDIRKILYALAVAMYEAYMALPAGDRPAKWVPGTSTQTTTSGSVQRLYNNRFTTTFTDETVAPE